MSAVDQNRAWRGLSFRRLAAMRIHVYTMTAWMILSVAALVVYDLALRHVAFPVHEKLTKQHLATITEAIGLEADITDDVTQLRALAERLSGRYQVRIEVFENDSPPIANTAGDAPRARYASAPISAFLPLSGRNQYFKVTQEEWPFIFRVELVTFLLVALLFYGPAMCSIVYWAESRFRELSNQAYQFIGQQAADQSKCPSQLHLFNARSTTQRLGETLSRFAANEKHASRSAMESLRVTAHEIRRPLNRLLFATQMADDRLRESDPELHMAIQDALDEMLELVDDALWHSRFTHGPVRVNSEPVDINATIERLTTKLAPQYADKQFNIQPPEQNTPEFHADRKLLERAISNLIVNAAAHGNKRIDVTWSWDDEHLSLSVLDDGPGIPPDKRETVFQPFIQLDQDKHDHRHSGLGLSIVKGICESHGGLVCVDESALGGAAFTLKLPLRPPNSRR